MAQPYGETVSWEPAAPRIGLLRLLTSLAILTASVYVAALLVPGVALESPAGGALVAFSLALLNAIVPPVLAALRLPFMVAIGFLLVLAVDAALLLVIDAVFPDWMRVDGFADALLAALVIAAVGMVLQVIAGTDDDDEYTLRVTRRIARRLGAEDRTDAPGIIFLEIDGLALPVLRRAMRDGNAPTMARWIAEQRLPPRRVGDRPLLADRCQPGRDPARLQRGHPGLPLGGEGDRDDDGLLVGRRLRRDRAPALDRHRPARRRRRQPREPPLRRGRRRDPHRQPSR